MSHLIQQPASPALDQPILRARGIKRAFRMGQETSVVLRQVDLALRPSEFVAIEGRSGSGKSTLLHILGALDAPDAGSIEYNAQDLGNLSGRERSRVRNTEFGFVFQFYHLLPELNVTENTLLAPMIEYSWLGFRRRSKALRDRAGQILTELGLGHRMRHKVTVLSGGERQRVAIARALMNSPKVLFADEPTGNLDAETGRQIMGVLEKLHREQGQTIVMVTHDRSLARQADRILVLKNGQLERPGETAAS
ncbi:MAG TPA: ABC transporter ATP-binding protein [Tepidisphaeraceae bacterium]|nr:ABC transporter ATP-binding protein [Tepidisphaeraceae bacterium]